MTTNPRLARDVTAAIRAVLPDPDRSVQSNVQRGNELLKPIITLTVPYEWGVRSSQELGKVLEAVKAALGVDVELLSVSSLRWSRNKPLRRRVTLAAQEPLAGDPGAAQAADLDEEAAARAATVIAHARARGRRP